MDIVDISFKADAEAIRNAIDVIKIVTPPGVGDQALQGFLWRVGKKVDRNADDSPGPEDGKDFCWVYSRDKVSATRAEFPITDVRGEGTFVYPLNHIESFLYVRGELSFEVHNDPDAGTYMLKWGYGDGACTERVSFNPMLLSSPFDKRLREATNHHQYRTAILKEALKGGKAFLASEQDKNAKDEYKIINIYDTDKGDGTLLSTDGYQRFYFQCDNFKGRGLQVHFNHISLLEQFLSKCGPEIVICTGSDFTYAFTPDKTRVLGWAKHDKAPPEYKSIPKSWDRVVVRITDRLLLVDQLNWIKAEMAKDRDKIRIKYNHEARQIRFHIVTGGKTTSLPIYVEPVKDASGKELEGRDYENDVNVKQMLGLFKDVQAPVVEFRMFPTDEHGGDKGGACFRTIDEFMLDKEGKLVGGSGATPDPEKGLFQCKVTRFMPSKH
jgi:hypothetical protein